MHALTARSLAGGLLVAIVGATPCFAQFGSGSTPLNAGQRAAHETQGQEKPQVAPPPVLPGTKTAPEAAAPTMSPSDMSPTEALFDAINRGDLAAARDAMNRGAELHGENVLGLTPLELSVDLGRNDISFLLLSLREGDATHAAGTQKGGDAKAALLRAGAASKRVSRSRVATVAAPASDEAVAEAPRIYSGNGGTPIPAAGFLGFGEGRAVR
jgi:hypothetical protein